MDTGAKEKQVQLEESVEIDRNQWEIFERSLSILKSCKVDVTMEEASGGSLWERDCLRWWEMWAVEWAVEGKGDIIV